MFGSVVKARRCSTCGISYPPEYGSCAVCESKDLWAMYKTGPDADWQERVAASLGEAVFVQPELAYGFAHPRESVSIPVSVAYDKLWFRHSDLIEAGYVNLEAGSVVWVNGRFFELQGPNTLSRRGDYSWWVEEIGGEGSADHLTPEMFMDAKEEDG